MSSSQNSRALVNAIANPDISITDGDQKQVRPRRGPRGKRTVRHGIVFQSREEADRYDVLLLWQRADLLRDLVAHPRYVIQSAFTHPSYGPVKAVSWTADFSYFQFDIGATVIEDWKGDYMFPTYLVKLPFILHALRGHCVFVNRGGLHAMYQPPIK